MPDDALFTAAKTGALKEEGLKKTSGPNADRCPDQPFHRRFFKAMAATAPRRHVPAGQKTVPGLR